ncbi:capsid protein [Enterococcus faecium]|nr:capsid protein [Enterococcus faecium]EME7159871.1 capsid protein [Enterococcus faecium]
MDINERLCDVINAIPNLPQECKIGYLLTDDSFQMYSIPGGRTISEDYAGNKDKELMYEVAIRTQDVQMADQLLWLVANMIEDLDELKSYDDSFKFESIEITGTPFISEQDIKGYSVYALNFKIKIIQLVEGYNYE